MTVPTNAEACIKLLEKLRMTARDDQMALLHSLHVRMLNVLAELQEAKELRDIHKKNSEKYLEQIGRMKLR